MEGVLEPCLSGRAGEQQLLPLLGGEQRQFGNAPLRVAQQRLQQVLPVSGHPRDARFVEQVAAVGQAAAEALVEVGDLQVEVELGRPRIVGDVLTVIPASCRVCWNSQRWTLHITWNNGL